MKITDRVILSAIAFTEGTRFANALSTFFANRYEAAMPSSPHRSFIPALVRDARYDANSWSRWEMTRKIRYFERNLWLLGKIRDEYIKWSIGTNGIPVIAASSDDDWNKAMDESYQEWCLQPCCDNTLTMSQVHDQIGSQDHLEGELFIQKTYCKSEGNPKRPAIQLIEGHRCSSPGQTYTAADEAGLIDGVQLQRLPNGNYGGIEGYWMLNGDNGDDWAFRSVDDVIHVHNPMRPGMFRDVTPYHSVLNTMHDFDDLELMEMDRAKANSEVSSVLTNAAGEISSDDKRRARYSFTQAITAPVSAKEDTIDKRIQAYRKVMGSRMIALKTGEKLEHFDSESPSAASQWYWRYKIGQVCAVGGVPMMLIFPELMESMQGTVVRAVLDNAHAGFRKKFAIYGGYAKSLYRFYAQWAIHNDRRVVDPPADWMKCHVIPPRAVNVDKGNNSANMLAELAAGTLNYDDIAGGYGTTAEVMLRKKARNIVLIKKIAAEEGCEPEEIAAPLADIVQKMAAADAATLEPDDENAPPEKGKDKKKVATKK